MALLFKYKKKRQKYINDVDLSLIQFFYFFLSLFILEKRYIITSFYFIFYKT